MSTGKKLIAHSGENNAQHEFTLKNDYDFYYKNQKLKFDIIEEADGFTLVSIQGVKYPVEIVSQKQNTYEILVNGVSYIFSIETPFSLKRKLMLANNADKSGKVKVKAPMPGKILDILVMPGQKVNKGDTLLILEAMKMQNTIMAQNTGTVQSISVKANDIVGKDDVLVEINQE